MNTATKNMAESEFSEEAKNVRLRVNPKVLSLEHLAQYTSGDVALELEVLGLFKDQAILQFENIEQAQNKVDWVMAVHTIKGSARGIGAGEVAEISAELEKVGFAGDLSAKQPLTNSLKCAVSTCVLVIETILATR